MRLGIVKSLMLIVATVATGADAQNPPPALSPDVAAFVGSPAHAAAVSAAASDSFNKLWGCSSSTAAPSSNIRVAADLGPVTFNAAHVPTSGVIEESVPVSGCAQTKLQNVFTMSNATQSKLVTSVPGTTLADPLLVRDTLGRVFNEAKPRLGECDAVRVIDTNFVSFDGGPDSKTKAKTTLGPPWHETWTVNGCGKTVPVTVHYTPDVTGIAIRAEAAN